MGPGACLPSFSSVASRSAGVSGSLLDVLTSSLVLTSQEWEAVSNTRAMSTDDVDGMCWATERAAGRAWAINEATRNKFSAFDVMKQTEAIFFSSSCRASLRRRELFSCEWPLLYMPSETATFGESDR